MIDRTHGGDIRQYPGKMIDFSASINPLGLSPAVKAAVIRNIDDVIYYPEPDSRTLKKTLGDFHGIYQDDVTVGNGSIELIYLLPKALQAKRILIITPSFSEYEIAARISGVKPVFFRTREQNYFKIEISRLITVIPKVNLVFLCNPNNPTGGYIAAEKVLSLAAHCERHGTFLVLDQAFADFTGDAGADILLSAARRNKALIIIRSLTKFFAVPGLRIGYAVGHRDIIRKVSGYQYPWNVNSLAQGAALAVLKDRAYMSRSAAYISGERRYLADNLSRMGGLEVYPASSNFILCRIISGGAGGARRLNAKLNKRGMVIRDCGNFRGLSGRFFRVAVRKRAENRGLISALKEFL